jgi:hypothetical protein
MSCCQREESIGSNRAETQVPNLVRVLIPGSARIERNVFSCSSANGVAELNAKSACAARPLAGSVWPAPNMRGVAERTVPYPRLLPAPAFVDPLWARHGGSARKLIASNRTEPCARVHRQTSARQLPGHRLGWFGKRDALFPLPGTHRSRRPASRRCAWPAVTLRAGAANPAEAARCIESPAAVGEVSGGRAEPVGSGACGGRFDSVTGWRPREG